MIAPAETGSGVPAAAGGAHFLDRASLGGAVAKAQRLAGWGGRRGRARDGRDPLVLWRALRPGRRRPGSRAEGRPRRRRRRLRPVARA
ncbi:MAG: hypothetical protein WDM85_03005 [Caulobacteraceae bacterium]